MTTPSGETEPKYRVRYTNDKVEIVNQAQLDKILQSGKPIWSVSRIPQTP